MAEPLDQDKIVEELKSLQGWTFDENKLKKEFNFDDFKEAMAFITLISYEAEDQIHHPEIFNVYSKVNIALSTHDAGDKVTEKDVNLAKSIEEVSEKF